MKGIFLMEGLNFVNEQFIAEAERTQIRKRNRAHKGALRRAWIAVTAAACFALSVPVFAATFPYFYDVLYVISPATAQFFKPVALSCVDNGIRMEVVAVYIHESTAEIYISMQDLEGGRFDETVDLFDSYNINIPFDCAGSTGYCEQVSFDAETQTATFLIKIEQWDKPDIIGDKLTFSVRQILSNKRQYEDVIAGINLTDALLEPETQKVSLRGFGGTGAFVARYRSDTFGEKFDALYFEQPLLSPMDGVTVTGVGYIGDELRIQVYYEDISRTDNHGWIDLKDKETGALIRGVGSISFFDTERKGSYEEYMFSGISPEELGAYELYGLFTTSDGPIEGDWSVTFPLETTESEPQT